MVQAIIQLDEHTDHVLNIVKGRYNLKNKSDAVHLVVEKFEEELLEPELRPEFIEKILKIEKRGKLIHYKSLEALRRETEHA